MCDAWDWTDLANRSRRFAARYAPAAADADDIAQSALLRAWRMRHSCREPDRPWPWLRTIVLHEALRHGSRSRPEAPPDALEELAAEDVALERALQRVDVQRAVRSLPHADRHVIGLRYGADQTQTAIAAHLGMAEGTVKVRLHRARRTLRNALNPT